MHFSSLWIFFDISRLSLAVLACISMRLSKRGGCSNFPWEPAMLDNFDLRWKITVNTSNESPLAKGATAPRGGGFNSNHSCGCGLAYLCVYLWVTIMPNPPNNVATPLPEECLVEIIVFYSQLLLSYGFHSFIASSRGTHKTLGLFAVVVALANLEDDPTSWRWVSCLSS